MTVQEQSNPAAASHKPKGALWKRVLSSIVLIPPPLLATYYGGPAFAALITFMAVLMMFEWARMLTGKDLSAVFYALAVGAAAALFSAAGGWFYAAFVICLAASITAAVVARRFVGGMGWAAFGAVYIIGPCIALIWLRDAVENGRALTFTLFVIVWMADIGAYFAGRFIGGPRISQALSPEKTWSGIVGGVIMGGIAGAAATKWIYGDGSAMTFVAIGASLGLASVLGDLAESAFKRIHGIKDSSGLIPGHGGVLDRLDGMIFATTAMTAVIFLHITIGRV